MNYVAVYNNFGYLKGTSVVCDKLKCTMAFTSPVSVHLEPPYLAMKTMAG